LSNRKIPAYRFATSATAIAKKLLFSHTQLDRRKKRRRKIRKNTQYKPEHRWKFSLIWEAENKINQMEIKLNQTVV